MQNLHKYPFVVKITKYPRTLKIMKSPWIFTLILKYNLPDLILMIFLFFSYFYILLYFSWFLFFWFLFFHFLLDYNKHVCSDHGCKNRVSTSLLCWLIQHDARKKEEDLIPFLLSSLFMIKYNDDWCYELDIFMQTYDLNMIL